MDRAAALVLLHEFVKSPALIRHCLAVEAAVAHYAKKLGEDERVWRITGLLHDFDYERFPEPPAHTREGAKILRERGLDDVIVDAILSHADWNLDQYPRDTPLRKTLFAVDELCGFIHAVAVIRPRHFDGLAAKSVKKKLKQKSFAAAVSRDDIQQGAVMVGLDLDEHINECIAAMATIAKELGLSTPPSE